MWLLISDLNYLMTCINLYQLISDEPVAVCNLSVKSEFKVKGSSSSSVHCHLFSICKSDEVKELLENLPTVALNNNLFSSSFEV